jgi:hypothetical protein
MNSLSRLLSITASLFVLCFVTESRAGEITFAFDYDASFISSSGASYSAATSDFAYVGNYLSSVIKTSGAYDITMKFTISGSNSPMSSTLGSAGSNFWGNNHHFNKTATQSYAQTGTNPGGSGVPVGNATFNFGKTWGFNGAVTGSQIDFRFVLLHEMTHAMGFIGAIGSTGTTAFGDGFYGWMDQYLYGWNGSSYDKLVQTSGSNLVAMSGASSAVVNSTHPVEFRGPNLLAYLGNSSTGQPMYTPSEFNDGSSIYHVNIPGNLMYYAIGNGPQSFGYSGLHLAFLKDLGYTVVPEPGTYALSIISVILVGAIGRNRRFHSTKSAA